MSKHGMIDQLEDRLSQVGFRSLKKGLLVYSEGETSNIGLTLGHSQWGPGYVDVFPNVYVSIPDLEVPYRKALGGRHVLPRDASCVRPINLSPPLLLSVRDEEYSMNSVANRLLSMIQVERDKITEIRKDGVLTLIEEYDARPVYLKSQKLFFIYKELGPDAYWKHRKAADHNEGAWVDEDKELEKIDRFVERLEAGGRGDP